MTHSVGHLALTFNSMLARLEEAYQRVNQALQMQRDFVADVSHELRTPLTTVRGNLALLNHKAKLSQDEQDDILTDLVEESDRMIRLVNDLLVMAQADARRSLTKEPVEVETVLEEATRLARQTTSGREILLSGSEIAVLGDRDALKQVVLILLDNAVKHSSGAVRVEAETLDSQGVIRVRDDRPGIPSEMLDHVFDRFYRGEDRMSGPGFGLGLSIAKTLVESMGGTITFESQPEQGSIVSVILQLTES